MRMASVSIAHDPAAGVTVGETSLRRPWGGSVSVNLVNSEYDP
jgi:hypothetical protein